MLVGVSDPKHVRELQHLLVASLAPGLPSRLRLVIGYQGGSIDTTVMTDGDLWHATNEIGAPEAHRYWNAFGLLSEADPSNIVVEVNMSLEGLNRRVGGVFAEDSASGIPHMLHRGSIAGGRPGIGKKAFLSWYQRVRPESIDEIHESDGARAKLILISPISTERLLPALHRFVTDVSSFKRLATR